MGEGARAEDKDDVFAFSPMVKNGVRGAGAVPAAPHRRTHSSRPLAFHSLRAHTKRHKSVGRLAREFGSRSRADNAAHARGRRTHPRAAMPISPYSFAGEIEGLRHQALLDLADEEQTTQPPLYIYIYSASHIRLAAAINEARRRRC
jgi:hypothetical protein